jgi:hypothetical protein
MSSIGSYGATAKVPIMKRILSVVLTREDVRGHRSGRREHCR